MIFGEWNRMTDWEYFDTALIMDEDFTIDGIKINQKIKRFEFMTSTHDVLFCEKISHIYEDAKTFSIFVRNSHENFLLKNCVLMQQDICYNLKNIRNVGTYLDIRRKNNGF